MDTTTNTLEILQINANTQPNMGKIAISIHLNQDNIAIQENISNNKATQEGLKDHSVLITKLGQNNIARTKKAVFIPR